MKLSIKVSKAKARDEDTRTLIFYFKQVLLPKKTVLLSVKNHCEWQFYSFQVMETKYLRFDLVVLQTDSFTGYD